MDAEKIIVRTVHEFDSNGRGFRVEVNGRDSLKSITLTVLTPQFMEDPHKMTLVLTFAEAQTILNLLHEITNI